MSLNFQEFLSRPDPGFAFFHDGKGWFGRFAAGSHAKSITLKPYEHALDSTGPDWKQFVACSRSVPLDGTLKQVEASSGSDVLPERSWSENRQAWEKLCAEASAGISAGKFKKVVPSRWRSTTLPAAEKEALIDLLADWFVSGSLPSSYKFLLRSGDSLFFGATPELLFQRAGGKITVPAIAGTQQISDPSDTGEKLSSSQKDIDEHEFVVDGLISDLGALGLHPKISRPRSLLRAGNLWHLHTVIEAHDPGVESLPSERLRDALHPSPAIGGFPRASAAGFLAEHEGWSRGLFSSPILIQDDQEQLCLVAIRSFLLQSETLWQFAGAGFVSGSNTESEWLECTNKMESTSRFFFRGPNELR